MSTRTPPFRQSRQGGSYRFALPLVILFLAVLGGFANVLSTGENRLWVSQRAEFSPVATLEGSHGEKFRSEFAPVLFMSKLGATNYLCVDESSVYYTYLTSHQELTGISIDSSCAPLDFTDRPADNLHPALITEPIGKNYLYYAFVIGFEPTSDTAVLLEARDGVFVLAHVDTLQHLGIDVEAPS